MGGKVWQRDGNSGKTYTTGIKADRQQQQQRPAPSRKRVWTRDAEQAPSTQAKVNGAAANGHLPANGAATAEKRRRLASQGRAASTAQEEWDGEVVFEMSSPEDVAAAAAAAAAAPGTSGSSATSRMQSAEEERAAAARKLAAAQAELAALKRNIEGREQRIAREQAEAAARADAERRRREDLARWKAKLDAGFPQAARRKTGQQDAAAKAAATADEREVARVLRARDDYEVLRLAPGAGAGALRKRYREMAVVLHPDKCSVARATDAFQRMVRAYNSLLRLAA